MAIIKCPECNSEISDKSLTCIKCGCPINGGTNTDNKNLKISYPKDGRPATPKIKVFINGRQIGEYADGTENELQVNESGTLLFKGSFRKVEVNFDCTKNYHVTLTWNTLTGKIVADVERW